MSGRAYCAGTALGLSMTSLAQAHAPTLEGKTGADIGNVIVVVLLLLSAAAYLFGYLRLAPHVHARREMRWRAGAFVAGWAALAVALLSPLDAAAHQSFALHMIQHETLMLVAAPLLVLGRGLPTMLWSLSHTARLAVGRGTKQTWVSAAWNTLTAPMTAWLSHAAALWIWHAPPLFNAALADGTLHDWQHVTFLVTALIFWHALLRQGAHAARGAGILYLFTTTIHTGVLGALLTFARRPLYAPLDAGLVAFGSLTPLEDQQLGGLIMWVPGAMVYVGAALLLLSRWLRAPPAATRERRLPDSVSNV